MNPPDNQRRRGRSRSPEAPPPPAPVLDSDPLSELRAALRDRDPETFADCFSAGGWVRVPRPEGDVVFRGPDEIAQAGRDLCDTVTDLSWTPSQRFLSAGQVVEEAVARFRKADPNRDLGPGHSQRPGDGEIRVSMRLVAAFDPAGGIGSLTLWIDWAALRDPLGVQSARGAASALVAQARARDARGLQVIEGSTPETGEPVVPVNPAPPSSRPVHSTRPAAPVVWWQEHRRTVAGSVMAVLAIAVIGWVSQNVLHPSNPGGSVLGAGIETQPTGGPGGASNGSPTGAPVADSTPSVAASQVPVIKTEKPSAKPTVQPGEKFTVQSDVLFETGSTRLSDSTMNTLKKAANQVRVGGLRGNIQINGYTDSDGSDALNLALSRDRATAVAKALREYLSGSPVTLVPQAFGENDPIADNTTDAGKSKNRRVNIILPLPPKP
jgi:outer membrane protein OmpA-like peptidoglycan-associated protein